MKNHRILLVALIATLANVSSAQQDVSGTWSGSLAVGPDTSIEIHFVLNRQADGNYSAVVTSPDPDGIQDVPATSASFESNRLVLVVDELSGSYEGSWESGTFNGEWRQEGAAIPLNLIPYVKPVLSQAAKDALSGSWVGKLETPGGALTIVYRFEEDADGNFVGYLDSPDQGADGMAISDIELADGQLQFKVARVRGEYVATMTEGGMEGTWTQGPQPTPLTMSRGEYTPESLDLSQEAMESLAGSWVGTVESPAGELTIVLRFETNDDGDFEGFLDSPTQGASGIPITQIALAQGELVLTIPAVKGEYAARLSEPQMQGTWKQGPGEQPLTMSRGEYTPTVAGLDLSSEVMQQVSLMDSSRSESPRSACSIRPPLRAAR